LSVPTDGHDLARSLPRGPLSAMWSLQGGSHGCERREVDGRENHPGSAGALGEGRPGAGLPGDPRWTCSGAADVRRSTALRVEGTRGVSTDLGPLLLDIGRPGRLRLR